MKKLFQPTRVIAFAFTACCLLAQAQDTVNANDQQAPPAADRLIDFVADVQPILREHCFECHSGDVEEGGLNLAVKSKAMTGGEHGIVLSPKDSASSVLIQLVTGIDEDRKMPPDGNDPLNPQQISILRDWIDQGATWPDGADVEDPRLDRAKNHWAFRPLKQVMPPQKNSSDSWSRSDIDLFIRQKLREHDLRPSQQATAGALVRRLYFDLIGLPPSPQQVSQFTKEHREHAFVAVSELIDQLLGSEHYGERWARHWLDVARYADSDGQESDRDRPHAYHYRDFVIRAFNDDMPYDQFVRWQIAGDEYEPDSDLAVSATGFLTAGPSMKLKDSFLERERLFNRYNELDDVISTLGMGFLGLTVGCARCHDHKYDAFSAREYYQLMSVFHSGDRISAKLPSGHDGFFFQDFDSTVRTTWLFRRSDFYDREIEVSLAFPAILSSGPSAEEYRKNASTHAENRKSTFQRRALADWITDVQHGAGALLARVFVNRVWQKHFGHGLVRTASDFGVRGDAPTHPELLEYLANDFVAHGWRLKRLHKNILTSAVWLQNNGIENQADATSIDPENRLLWKRSPQRLEAEALRDAMLAVSGTLNLEAYGPGFKPYIQPEANLARNIQGAEYPADAKDNASTRRRSVYMFHKRLIPYPLFQAFDRPELMTSCSRRQNTTVAPQAMAILNDTFVRSVARDFARRLVDANPDNLKAVVRESFERSFARSPKSDETAAAVQFMKSQADSRRARHESDPDFESVADYCHALFGLNEFIYVD